MSPQNPINFIQDRPDGSKGFFTTWTGKNQKLNFLMPAISSSVWRTTSRGTVGKGFEGIYPRKNHCFLE
jgi:hypothetical protein